jgi:hypothetical protein
MPNPNKKTIGMPPSDETARTNIDERDMESRPDDTNDEGRQISNKSGKHSSAEKLAASRPNFGPSPGANPAPGAHGERGKDKEQSPSGAQRDKALKP